MAMEPEILLMDEPFAALDALTRSKMQEELLQLWEDTRFTMLFVTHSIPEAVVVGNRILLMSPHPGQVKVTPCFHVPPPPVLFRPSLTWVGRDATGGDGRRLSERIHDMLFADEIEEKTDGRE
jgi:NitT/TauT family transport system ATP-binding protein